jgi:outer membrane protein assembly factor BamB
VATDDRQRAAALERFWDGLVHEADPEPEDVEPEIAELARRVHALGVTPDPDRARAQVWERLTRHPLLRGTAISVTATLAHPPIRVPQPPPRARPVRHSAISHLALALLLLVTFAAVYVALRPTTDETMAPAGGSPAAVAIPTRSADVPMFQGDPARTGAMPGPGPVGTPIVRWRFATGGAVVGAPALVDGVLYVGSDDGNLYALDARTGRERWRFSAGLGIASSPAVVGGTVYVGAGDATTRAVVAAVDAATGRERWSRDVEGPVAASPVVADGALYVGTNAGILYAFDAATGQPRWQFPVGGDLYASPAYADGAIFVGSWDGTFYTIDAATGTERWRFAAGGAIWAAPPVVDGIVYVAGPNTSVADRPISLWALDAATGRTRWETDLPGSSASVQDRDLPVAVMHGVVYLQRDQNLYAVDAASGRLLWTAPPDGRSAYAPAALTANVIYFALDHGSLLAVDASSGTRLWEVQVGDAQMNWPIVAGGFLYVGDDGGVLYALADREHGAASAGTPP